MKIREEIIFINSEKERKLQFIKLFCLLCTIVLSKFFGTWLLCSIVALMNIKVLPYLVAIKIGKSFMGIAVFIIIAAILLTLVEYLFPLSSKRNLYVSAVTLFSVCTFCIFIVGVAPRIGMERCFDIASEFETCVIALRILCIPVADLNSDFDRFRDKLFKIQRSER